MRIQNLKFTKKQGLDSKYDGKLMEAEVDFEHGKDTERISSDTVLSFLSEGEAKLKLLKK